MSSSQLITTIKESTSSSSFPLSPSEMVQIKKKELYENAPHDKGVRTNWRDSLRFILKGSIASFIAGSFVGVTAGVWRGAKPPIFGFIYGSNWMLIGTSFFTIRECLLHYRHFINDRKGVKHHFVRNIDSVVASAGSGLIVGGFFSFHSSGPWAMIGGSIAYASICTSSQLIVNVLRQWKQNRALDMFLHPERFEKTNMFGRGGWWSHKYGESDADTVQFPNQDLRESMAEFDPVVWGFNHARDFGKEYVFGEYPEWANCFVYAFDLGYKNKLKEKLRRVEAEISALKELIQEKEDKQSDRNYNTDSN